MSQQGDARAGKGRHKVIEAWRRIRKPMPPPDRVIPDKRRKTREQEAEREIREGE